MVLPSREEIKQAVRPALSATVVVVAIVVVVALLVRRLDVFVLPGLAVMIPCVWIYQLHQVRTAQSL